MPNWSIEKATSYTTVMIIFDTNVWPKELVLNCGAGSALRFHIKNRGDRVALPEVIRLEVLGKARMADVVDAFVVTVALRNKAVILTSDVDHIQRVN